MATITLSNEVEKAVGQYAEKRGMKIGEAANSLIASGIKRLAAIHKYAASHKSPAKAKPAKKAAKAKPAKKAAKAKGPIARKAKKAAPVEAAAQ